MYTLLLQMWRSFSR